MTEEQFKELLDTLRDELVAKIEEVETRRRNTSTRVHENSKIDVTQSEDIAALIGRVDAIAAKNDAAMTKQTGLLQQIQSTPVWSAATVFVASVIWRVIEHFLGGHS